MNERIDSVIEYQIENLKKLKSCGFHDTIIAMSEDIVEAMKNGHKVFIAGNGGSAADSQHFAAELVGRFIQERKGLPAIALTTDSSILTCMGNDYGFDDIFRRQVEALGQEGDIFIGISTSGNSKNIVFAIEQCKKQGIQTFALTGKTGGEMKKLCDRSLVLDYNETARIQEHHIMAIHLLCEFVEKAMKAEQEQHGE